MNSDRPVSTQEEDHFNRWNLAKGVAAELAVRHDYGICVGIYGPWGAGKTSFLKFVEAHLKEADHHDVIWQNGWLGHSWEIHAQILFQRIFESVGEDIATKGQRAAQSFKEWLNLAAVKLKIGAPTGIFSAEVSTSGVAGFLHQVAQIDLVKLREVLAQKKESKPFIVFIDDIDRQETQEIKELFRLLRFFSELPGVNVLIAMDPEIVAPALQEAYKVDGFQVLEKFIQVPLNRIFNRQWGSLGAGEVLEILKLLFPQIKGLTSQTFSTPQYSQYEVGPRYHKRLCHDDFFHRYFEFCISDNEIKESEIDLFVERLNNSEELEEDFFSDFFRLLQLDSFRFILGLESRLEKIAATAGKRLAMLLAASAGELSTENAKHHIFRDSPPLGTRPRILYRHCTFRATPLRSRPFRILSTFQIL